jgi:hypothetical protein
MSTLFVLIALLVLFHALALLLKALFSWVTLGICIAIAVVCWFCSYSDKLQKKQAQHPKGPGFFERNGDAALTLGVCALAAIFVMALTPLASRAFNVEPGAGILAGLKAVSGIASGFLLWVSSIIRRERRSGDGDKPGKK